MKAINGEAWAYSFKVSLWSHSGWQLERLVVLALGLSDRWVGLVAGNLFGFHTYGKENS